MSIPPPAQQKGFQSFVIKKKIIENNYLLVPRGQLGLVEQHGRVGGGGQGGHHHRYGVR